MIRIAGGRNTIFLTTALLMIPAAGAGIALQSQDTPLWVFQLLAFLSGIGGGNFACSMSNISTFFPKNQQGLALGLNAGLGNFGVTTMQILIPLVMTAGVFGAMAGAPMELIKDSGTLIGKISAGTETWIQNAGWVWLLFLVPLAFAGWFGMNNLLVISPTPGYPLNAFGKILGLYAVAFAAALGLYLYLPAPTGLGVLNMWGVMLLTIGLTLGMLRMLPGSIKPNIKRQFTIFSDKHTWSMSILYILTFGSFIGFSMALPLSITVIFGFMNEVAADGTITRVANPNAPSALTYAWIGPFIGALIRPLGGWISDKVGGSIVTQVISVVMVIASVAAGYVMHQAYGSAQPEVLLPLPGAVPSAVRCQRHRQRLHLPHHRRDLRPREGRPGPRLDLRRRRLRLLRRPHRDRRAGQGRYPRSGDVRLRGVLRAVPDPQLVVLPAPQRLCEEP